MPRPLLLVPALMAPALLAACSGGEGGADYDLTITPVLPRNQGALLTELDRMDLVVQDGSEDPPTFELQSLTAGDSSVFDELSALDGAVLELRGYVGNTLRAYGRTEPLTLSTGSLELRILVAAVDGFGEMNPLSQPSSFSALGAGGNGRFVLFGGNEDGVYSDESTDAIWALDLAPPTDGLLFEELDVVMPPRDDGGEGRICHSATALTRGDHDLVGRILVAGGAEVIMTEEDSAFAPDMSTVTWSSFLFDAETDTIDVLSESAALVQPRCAHTATELPSGDVVLVGGLAFGSPGEFNANPTAEIYNPVIGGFELADGTPEGPFLFHAAAALADEGVLVCGGLMQSGSAWAASDACDLVTASGDISSAGAGPAALIHSAMAPLPDGRVLMAGGAIPAGTSQLFNFPADVTNEAWIYDGSSWGPADAMAFPRAMHKMVPLPDGDVLVVGGTTEIADFWNIVWGSSAALPCAELYDADTGRFAIVGDCDVDLGLISLPEPVAMPGVAVDADFGALVAGGLNENEAGATGVSLYVPTP